MPIKPGIMFQPHPAFARDAQGKVPLPLDEAGRTRRPAHADGLQGDGTRELTAEDFVYAVKRHATTRITTPIYSVFSVYVLGLKSTAT